MYESQVPIPSRPFEAFRPLIKTITDKIPCHQTPLVAIHEPPSQRGPIYIITHSSCQNAYLFV
eukprot:scaffold1533_cov98-Cylindrotheca_fusiformis.AAC.2